MKRGGRETGAVSRTSEVAREPECSGFLGRPKVVAVFAARRGIGGGSLPENVPILSSVPNIPPILHVEDS